jgi:signal peptidase II
LTGKEEAFLYFWLSMLAVVVADRLSKLWIVSHFRILESHSLLDGFLSITFIRNYGAAFGILDGQRWLFMIVACGVLAGMIWFYRRYRPDTLMQLALGFVGGGAGGNMADRVYYGAVVDFISVGWWPVFNLADVAIVSGCFVLALLVFRAERGDVT